MTNPFRSLHPTLKKCKCNFVGPRTAFHRHVEQVGIHYRKCGMSSGEFFADHGEVPCYVDDEGSGSPEQLKKWDDSIARADAYEKFLDSI